MVMQASWKRWPTDSPNATRLGLCSSLVHPGGGWSMSNFYLVSSNWMGQLSCLHRKHKMAGHLSKRQRKGKKCVQGKDPFHIVFMNLLSKFCENIFCCNLGCNDPSMSQICPGHGGLVVITSAKLWLDQINICRVTAKYILEIFGWWVNKLLVKCVPGVDRHRLIYTDGSTEIQRYDVNSSPLCIFQISLKFVPKGPIDNNPALPSWIGHKPLSEPMLTFQKHFWALKYKSS